MGKDSRRKKYRQQAKAKPCQDIATIHSRRIYDSNDPFNNFPKYEIVVKRYVCREWRCWVSCDNWGPLQKHVEKHGIRNMSGMQQLCDTQKNYIENPPSVIRDPTTDPTTRITCLDSTREPQEWKAAKRRFQDLSCLHVIDDDAAVNYFTANYLPGQQLFITNRRTIVGWFLGLNLDRAHVHPLVKRIPAGSKVCITCCDKSVAHPRVAKCEHCINLSHLKELYPPPNLQCTPETLRKSQFHFWLSTNGGRRLPVHKEYRSNLLNDFNTKLQDSDLEKKLEQSVQHLISIMKRKKIATCNKNGLKFDSY